MALLSKQEFCNIINNMKTTEKYTNELNNIHKKYNKDSVVSFPEHTDLINVLNIMFDDTSELIEYWIYELNFGDLYEDGCITENDDTNIILKTAEDLYDYLIKEMNDKNEN